MDTESVNTKRIARNGEAGPRNGNGKRKAPAKTRAPAESLDRRQLLIALTALKKGDFSVRLPLDWEGLDGKISDTFNEVLDLNDKVAKELERVARVVGKEGKIAQRA